ncbi:hypothetical protein X975_20989, partial [Stegodyphus mimosarum]
MKEWEISAPYVLPRIVSFKRRSNTLPTKLPKPNLRPQPLGDVNARWTAWRRSDYFYPEMIPEPDYSESEEEEDESDEEKSTSVERLRDMEEEDEDAEDVKKRRAIPPSKFVELSKSVSETQKSSSDEELIQPRKPSYPFQDSTERQKLHKELKFNQKYGKFGVNPKTELQRALQKYTESKLKRDLAASKQTSLEKILEQQARKIEMQEREGDGMKCPAWIERLQKQQNMTWADPKKDEFFRVHARVVNSLMTSKLMKAISCQSSTESSLDKESSSSESSPSSE